MIARDRHQPRTFVFRPGETITIKVTANGKDVAARLRAQKGDRPVEASPTKVVFRMPKEGLGMSNAELDVNFGGRWNQLHQGQRAVDVSFRGSKGRSYRQRIIAGPKHGRWTYRIVSAAPRSTLYFCPEADCPRHMAPTHEASGTRCAAGGGSRRLSLKISG